MISRAPNNLPQSSVARSENWIIEADVTSLNWIHQDSRHKVLSRCSIDVVQSLSGVSDSDLRVWQLQIKDASIQGGHPRAHDCRSLHSIQAYGYPFAHAGGPAIN